MKNKLFPYIREAVRLVPEVLPLLSEHTQILIGEPYKSEAFFTANLRRLVVYLYSQTTEADDTARNIIVSEILATMSGQISDQLYDAYTRAWNDEEEIGGFPNYLYNAWQADVRKQELFVRQFLIEIALASAAGLPIAPFLLRVDLWANRWNEAYNNAIALIADNSGGNLVWHYGDTEHCDTCRSLNGIVASANEWTTAGVKPQNAPNPLIDCGGWNCQCTLERTTARRSPKALDSIMNIIIGRTL